MPNNVGVIYNKRKQTRKKKNQPNYGGHENELGQKKNHQTDPLNRCQWRIEKHINHLEGSGE